MLFSYYLCFPVMLALPTFLVACVTWKWFWSCARPENDFGRVRDLKMILVVCSTWKWFWSCVPPEKDFSRVLNLRKIFVVCSTRKCLGRMLTATERLILAVLSIWKRFGLVSDLRQILVMCTTCGRFLSEYSTWQRRFVLCSVLEESGRVYVRPWKEFGCMSHLLLLYFLLGFFSLPAPTVTRREINTTPYNPS